MALKLRVRTPNLSIGYYNNVMAPKTKVIAPNLLIDSSLLLSIYSNEKMVHTWTYKYFIVVPELK